MICKSYKTILFTTLFIIIYINTSQSYAVEDNLSPIRVCNSQLEKVSFIEGVADPFRLIVSAIGSLRNEALLEACWLRVENRLFNTGTLDYYIGFFLPILIFLFYMGRRGKG